MSKLHYFLRFLCVTIFIVAVFSGSKVYANNAALKKIEVTTGDSNIQILLDTNKKTDIKKASGKNKLVLTLKNTKADKNANILYSNTSNIEHILLKQAGKDLEIVLVGKNVESSTLLLNDKRILPVQHIFNIKLFMILLFAIMILCVFPIFYSRKNKTKVKVSYSVEDTENKILKVEFNRRSGLIAQGTGIQRKMQPRTIAQYNVRRVDFYNIDEVKLQNV